MLFADTMAIFFVIVGLLLTFPSIWLLCRGLWPGRVQRASEVVGMKSFFIGLPITALAVFIVIVAGKIPGPPGQIAGVLSFSALFLFAQVGVSGIATHLGRRLSSPVDEEKPWRATLRGGIILVLSYLLPLVGWFLILPVSIITGAGAAACSLWLRRAMTAKITTDSATPAQVEASSAVAANVGSPEI